MDQIYQIIEQLIKTLNNIYKLICNKPYKNPFVYSLIGVVVSLIIFDLNWTSQKDILIIILIFLICCVVFSFIFDLLIPSIKKFVKNHREIKSRKEQENRKVKLRKEQEDREAKLRKEQENKLTQYLLNTNEQQKQYILEFDPYLSCSRKFPYTDYTFSCSDEKYALEDMVENKVFQRIDEEEYGCEYNENISYVHWKLKLTEEAIKVINENNLIEKWKIENNDLC